MPGSYLETNMNVNESIMILSLEKSLTEKYMILAKDLLKSIMVVSHHGFTNVTPTT